MDAKRSMFQFKIPWKIKLKTELWSRLKGLLWHLKFQRLSIKVVSTFSKMMKTKSHQKVSRNSWRRRGKAKTLRKMPKRKKKMKTRKIKRLRRMTMMMTWLKRKMKRKMMRNQRKTRRRILKLNKPRNKSTASSSSQTEKAQSGKTLLSLPFCLEPLVTLSQLWDLRLKKLLTWSLSISIWPKTKYRWSRYLKTKAQIPSSTELRSKLLLESKFTWFFLK